MAASTRRAPAPGQRRRVAVVGAGGIAELCHVPAVRAESERAELVAAVDVDAQRLAAFCQRTGVPAGYLSLDAMLDAERPDLVHVCSPPDTHVDQVVRCLEAGAWVLVEKPPCLSLAEFDRIEAAERASGGRCGVVFQHRFGSAARHAAKLIGSGELGRPLVALCQTTWYRDQRYFDVPWRGTWASEGGGPTLGHGIHQMDLLLALLGEWTEVRAMAATLDRDVQTEDVSTACVRFGSGALASVVNSVLSPREVSHVRIDLTEATVEVTHLYGYTNADWRYTPAPHVTDAGRVAAWHEPGGDVPSSHAAQLPLVLDALDTGEPPPVGSTEARRTMELITAVYRSAFTGQPVCREQLGPHDPFYHRLDGGCADG